MALFRSTKLRNKLSQYIAFIDDTLQPELKFAISARERIEAEIKEYQELSDFLSILVKASSVLGR